MKTITIREDLYEKLVRLKRKGESFSDVIERLLDRPRVSIRFFAGK
ncbi:MAG: antitoxin, partial [Thermoprotei archaeon]